jgi:hypothetical protein
MRNLPPLPDEVWADPGNHDWYFREKKPDSVAKYIRADRITALEAQVAAADRLAEAADGLRDAHWNNPHGISGRHINDVTVALAAFRAAKGE